MSAPGEFEIIERWFTRASADRSVRVGIGDDAAVVDAHGPIAVAVDMLVAGTHFPESLPAESVGHRALAVNLSDMAAMGAKPRWATLALSLPAADPGWLDAFARGFFGLAERFGVSLIGGDTTRGPLTVTVGIMGELASEPLLRSGGQPGDLVFVSGTLGDSAAALEWLDRESTGQGADAAALIRRFRYPEPRVGLGRRLAGLAHAAIDVSDGLQADLGHICERSGTGAVIALEALPLSAELGALYPLETAQAFALTGGDDYELCFTAAAAKRARIEAAAAAEGLAVAVIGELTAKAGLRATRGGREVPLAAGGFAHF